MLKYSPVFGKRCVVAMAAFVSFLAHTAKGEDKVQLTGLSDTERTSVHALLPSIEQHSNSETELPYRLRAGSIDRSVVLSNNPATGYAWQILSEGNTTCATVELINRPRKPTSTAVVGAPEQTIVKVHALRPGTSHVELVYCRAWEKDSNPARRILLRIKVIPAR